MLIRRDAVQGSSEMPSPDRQPLDVDAEKLDAALTARCILMGLRGRGLALANDGLGYGWPASIGYVSVDPHSSTFGTGISGQFALFPVGASSGAL